jgi:hypothetical protein
LKESLRPIPPREPPRPERRGGPRTEWRFLIRKKRDGKKPALG